MNSTAKMTFNIILSLWLVVCIWRVIRLEQKLLELSNRNMISLLANIALVKVLKDKGIIVEDELETEVRIKQ